MGKENFNLESIAKDVMIEKGLQPDYPEEVFLQLDKINSAVPSSSNAEDLRSLLWCSIDNDDSRDLDQLTYAEKSKNGDITFWIAVADVEGLVFKDTPIDEHAQFNTTSVYTPAKIFAMLPEKLSTNLTSLNEDEDRLAVVVKMTMNPQGDILQGVVVHATVHNNAKLTYSSVGAWLEGQAEVPEKVKGIKGLDSALLCQHEAAQILRLKRHAMGALTLETIEVDAKVSAKEVLLTVPAHNYAHELIEDFMIAANSVIAKYFYDHKITSLRRVVRIPNRWDRIVEIAAQFGERLPEQPNSQALDKFLIKRKKADPETFPELSLAVIKLLGRGEYVVEIPGDPSIGHFGLALTEYTHSTAPNRRYPDLISQRQLKADFKGKENPYSTEELQWLAAHCTQQEDAANKVERHMNKSAAAMYLSSRIGESFKGIITGASEKGTWVRILKFQIEGKVVKGYEHLDVGDKVMVKLIDVNVPRGFIDFIIIRNK